MRDPLRQRVHEAALVVKSSSRTRIYNVIRATWLSSQQGGAGKRTLELPKAALPESVVEHLLARPPHDLSMEELVALADHIEVAGLTNRQRNLSLAGRWSDDALPVAAAGALAGAEISAAGLQQMKQSAMRYSLWLGYVAAPVLSRAGRFGLAVGLLHRFTLRLLQENFRFVEGAGGGSDSGMRLLITAPAIAGLAQYCPEELDLAAFKRLNSYIALTMEIEQLSECVTLRVACLGIVARHPASANVLPRARSIANGRFERRLAAAFDVFAEHPERLDASSRFTAA